MTVVSTMIVTWLLRFRTRYPLPWGAGRIRFRVLPPSTNTVFTTKEESATLCPSFFCSQFFTADHNSLCSGVDECCG